MPFLFSSSKNKGNRKGFWKKRKLREDHTGRGERWGRRPPFGRRRRWTRFCQRRNRTTCGKRVLHTQGEKAGMFRQRTKKGREMFLSSSWMARRVVQHRGRICLGQETDCRFSSLRLRRPRTAPRPRKAARREKRFPAQRGTSPARRQGYRSLSGW